MSVGTNFSSWSKGKKYTAALFYLAQVHSTPVNEAQWARLNALQSQIAHGDYIDGAHLPDLVLCSVQERKKREEEWKSLVKTPKSTALKQFLDIMNNLFPNWHKSKVMTERFDSEWTQVATITPNFEGPIRIAEASEATKKHLHRGIQAPLREHKSYGSLHTALNTLDEYELKKLISNVPKLPKLNAKVDAASTMSKLKLGTETEVRQSVPTIPKYCRRSFGPREFSDENENEYKTVLEGFYDNLSSGKVATKRESSFLKKLNVGPVENILGSLTQWLESAKVIPPVPDQISFPSVSVSQLESLLRPKLEMHGLILKEVGFSLADELADQLGLMASIHKEFMKAIDCLFAYLKDAENRREAVERRLEDVEFDYDTYVVSLGAMAELHNLENLKSGAFGTTKLSKSEYQLEVSRGFTVLKDDKSAQLKQFESTLSQLSELLRTAQSQLVKVTMERDKLQDMVILIEAGAVYQQISRPEHIAEGHSSKERVREKELSKELDELKDELADLRRENDVLNAKLKKVRMPSRQMEKEGSEQSE